MEKNNKIPELSVQEKLNIQSDCRADCSICNHPLLQEIHKLKEQGLPYNQIEIKINAQSNQKITRTSVGRHFANWKKVVQIEMMKKGNNLAEIEADKIITCQKWTDQLLIRTFRKIWDNFDTMQLDISDLERLAKLRILLKDGDSSAGDGITTILERAANKYNIKFGQNTLFQTEEKNPFKNSIEIKEETSSPEARTEKTK
jgi:hypothetical protein